MEHLNKICVDVDVGEDARVHFIDLITALNTLEHHLLALRPWFLSSSSFQGSFHNNLKVGAMIQIDRPQSQTGFRNRRTNLSYAS